MMIIDADLGLAGWKIYNVVWMLFLKINEETPFIPFLQLVITFLKSGSNENIEI